MCRALVVGILPIDTAYFQAHPAAWEYRRAPLPDEWGELAIPIGACVRVYLITCQCVVRALEHPDGLRLATVIDREATPAIRSQVGADAPPDWRRRTWLKNG